MNSLLNPRGFALTPSTRTHAVKLTAAQLMRYAAAILPRLRVIFAGREIYREASLITSRSAPITGLPAFDLDVTGSVTPLTALHIWNSTGKTAGRSYPPGVGLQIVWEEIAAGVHIGWVTRRRRDTGTGWFDALVTRVAQGKGIVGRFARSNVRHWHNPRVGKKIPAKGLDARRAYQRRRIQRANEFLIPGGPRA